MPQKTRSEHAPIPRLIRCIGVDDLQHVCLPEAKAYKCGVAVKRKVILRDDHKLASCYACTY